MFCIIINDAGLCYWISGTRAKKIRVSTMITKRLYDKCKRTSGVHIIYKINPKVLVAGGSTSGVKQSM